MVLNLNWIALSAAALLVFWAFGAYNRLMRERAAAIKCFADLGHATEERAAVLLRMAHAQLVHVSDAEQESLWHRMEACVQQSANAAAHAAVRPLDAPRIKALSIAQSALAQALDAVRTGSQDLAGAPWPGEVQQDLARSEARVMTQSENFDACVAVYNESIAQYPTGALAWLFGLRAAQTLG